MTIPSPLYRWGNRGLARGTYCTHQKAKVICIHLFKVRNGNIKHQTMPIPYQAFFLSFFLSFFLFFFYKDWKKQCWVYNKIVWVVRRFLLCPLPQHLFLRPEKTFPRAVVCLLRVRWVNCSTKANLPDYHYLPLEAISFVFLATCIGSMKWIRSTPDGFNTVPV